MAEILITHPDERQKALKYENREIGIYRKNGDGFVELVG